MKKKNGFIATSILYSFFLVFITLFVGLIGNYFQNKVLLTNLNDASKNIIKKINNLKTSDLKVGDHVNFKLSETQTLIKSNSDWILSYIETDETYTYYYFLSEISAQNLDIRIKLSTDKIIKVHSMTLDVYEDLLTLGAYQDAILYPNTNITVPTISLMENIRNQSLDPAITKSIYGVDGNYIIKADKTIHNYEEGKYYEYRLYRFNEKNQEIVNNYCLGIYSNSLADYQTTNNFGYINLEKNNDKDYANYCFYANPNSYEHNRSDNVVSNDEIKEKGDLIEDTNSSVYTFRLVATVKVFKKQTNNYISGGKGTKADPYTLTDGVRVS